MDGWGRVKRKEGRGQEKKKERPFIFFGFKSSHQLPLAGFQIWTDEVWYHSQDLSKSNKIDLLHRENIRNRYDKLFW